MAFLPARRARAKARRFALRVWRPMLKGRMDKIRKEIDAGNLVLAHDLLQGELGGGTDDPELRYLLVMVLARMALTDRALAAYQDLRLAELGTTDARALFARLLKDRALAQAGAGRREALRAAAEAYRVIHDDTGQLFPAVNAASLYLLACEDQEAVRLAERIAAAPCPAAPDYYDLATRAEAQIILQRYDEAVASLLRARGKARSGTGARAGTARQIGLVLHEQGADAAVRDAVLGALSIGRAVFYCGRMFEADARIEEAIRAEIRAFLASGPVAAAFGSLACGSDILIAEEMIAHGVPLFAYLATPPEVFFESSVRIGGPAWKARFEACLRAATEVHVVSEPFHAEEPLAHALTSRIGMGMAARHAAQNLGEPCQLAILGGADVAGREAGTNADIERWRAAGRPSAVIHAPQALRRPAPKAGGAEEPPIFTRREVSLLFADFAGFSALPDQALPSLVGHTFAALAGVLDAAGPDLIFRNTWGDACFAVFTGPAPAASAAQDLLRSLRRPDAGRGMGGLRISLHHGLAMEMFDAVLRKPNYFGRVVNRAARIEPVTPPDCIYASEAFVGAACSDGPPMARFEYVGRVPLPKSFGDERLYLVTGLHAEG